MKTFAEFLQSHCGGFASSPVQQEGRGPDAPSLPSDPQANPLTSENVRETLVHTRNLISNFEPRDVEDTKDILLSLKEVVEDKLTGA